MSERRDTRSPSGTAAPQIDSGGTDLTVDVGVLIAPSPQGDRNELRAFTEDIATTAQSTLTAATDTPWQFHPVEIDPLPDGNMRRPSAFIDDALHRIAEHPFDVYLVVTDVPLTSHRKRAVAGLSSVISRTVVISTRKLTIGALSAGPQSLDSIAVRSNGATLLLHLIGHVLGAEHGSDGGVMEPFRFDPDRQSVPTFESIGAHDLRRLAAQIPDSSVSRGVLGRLVFHGRSMARNPGTIARAVAGSRGVLLPLSLPKLATAAVTPSFILVFSAETWDVGLHLGNGVAAVFALVSVLAATVHLVSVHNLFFPREPEQTITENMALVNVTIFLVLLAGMVGLFGLVGMVVLFIEVFVFPPDLMTNWPSLESPTVDALDLIRTAAFISTLGVLSGALAGGVENRSVIGHLALFRDRP
jgi:hypothetical protein